MNVSVLIWSYLPNGVKGNFHFSPYQFQGWLGFILQKILPPPTPVQVAVEMENCPCLIVFWIVWYKCNVLNTLLVII